MFYLTLPSNSSMTTFPDNTVANFRVKLPQALDLSGRWEVGLTEIQYPHSWCNVGENTHFVEVLVPNAVPDDADSTVATAEDFTLVLNKGFYHSPKKLVDRLENLRSSVKKLHDRLKFKFDEVSQKVTLFLKPRTSARLSPPLARLLGFDMTDIPYGRNKGSRVSDRDQGFSSLYVYCNVVQPTVVGDIFVPLLRIVPVEGKTGHTVTRTYQNIQYLPVQANNFETVEIQIAKDTGELVPFERGKAVVTLHFRKVHSL